MSMTYHVVNYFIVKKKCHASQYYFLNMMFKIIAFLIITMFVRFFNEGFHFIGKLVH